MFFFSVIVMSVISCHVMSCRWFAHLIELDDGKIETGKPNQFDGKNHGFRFRFSLKPIHWTSQPGDPGDSESFSRGERYTFAEHSAL